MKPHFKREFPDGLIFDDGDFLLGHKPFIFFRKTAVEVVFRDTFKNAITDEFEAFIGLGMKRHGVIGAVDKRDILEFVQESRTPGIRPMDECAFVKFNIVDL